MPNNSFKVQNPKQIAFYILLVLISVLYHILLRLHHIVQRSSFLHEIQRNAKYERLSFSFRLKIPYFPVNILIYRLKRSTLTRIDPAPSFADTIHISQDRPVRHLNIAQSDCKRAYTILEFRQPSGDTTFHHTMFF